MDYINKLKEIVPKMKMQMHSNKDIFSLNEIYMVIAGFDKENKGKCPRAKFENSFLSLLGIYLKTQELTELFKYLCIEGEEEEMISFEKFIELFKRNENENLDKAIDDIYKKLIGQNTSVTLEELYNRLKLENHPLVRALRKTKEEAKKKIDLEFQFILGDNKEVTKDDFITFNKNMFCVMPEKNIDYWVKYLPEVWGIKVSDF